MANRKPVHSRGCTPFRAFTWGLRWYFTYTPVYFVFLAVLLINALYFAWFAATLLFQLEIVGNGALLVLPIRGEYEAWVACCVTLILFMHSTYFYMPLFLALTYLIASAVGGHAQDKGRGRPRPVAGNRMHSLVGLTIALFAFGSFFIGIPVKNWIIGPASVPLTSGEYQSYKLKFPERQQQQAINTPPDC